MIRPMFLSGLLLLATAPARAGLPVVAPERLGFDPARLGRIDAVVDAAIAGKKVPGAVVVVGRGGSIAYAKAFGLRSVEPAEEKMTVDTVFDMASLTKPVATATSAMILLELGKLRLDDKLATLLPKFDNHGKGVITVAQLLRHRAGLIADNPIGDFADGPDRAWERMSELGLEYPPGSGYVYTDVGFMTLGKVVEALSGQTLDAFARSQIFRAARDDRHRLPASPTRRGSRRRNPTRGRCSEASSTTPAPTPSAGVAGHAGLFGTAGDLAIYASTLLNGGLGPNGRRILSPMTVRAMTDPGDTPAGQRRGLGWDIATPHSAPRGDLFGPRSFGHTGFTGTSLWVDPRDLDVRHRPDEPAPPRRQGEVPDRPPARRRDDRRVVDR